MSAAQAFGRYGADLTPADFEFLAERFITPEMAVAAGVRRLDSHDGRELIGRKRGDLAGLGIPNIFPGESYAREHTLRLDRPAVEIDPASPSGYKESGKYVRPPGSRNLAYFAYSATPEDLQNIDLPIIWVEGEFKVLAVDRAVTSAGCRRALPIGLSGVWNFRGKIGTISDATGKPRDVKGNIPDFDRILWRGRTVYIAFDSDACHKPGVMAARFTLMRALRGKGANVGIIEWSEADGKGPDDFLVNKGAAAFLELFDAASTEEGGWKSQLMRSDKGKPQPLCEQTVN
jgi:hypothetical protein